MRVRKKSNKISIHLTLDAELIEKSNKYISNLSAYLNKCLENAIRVSEVKEKKLNETISTETTTTQYKEREINNYDRKVHYEQEQIWWDD